MLGKIGTTLSQKTIVRTLLFRIGLVTGIAFILLGISFHLHPLGSLKAYLDPQAQTSATTIPTALVFVIVAILITYGILLRLIISKTLGNQLKAVTQGIRKFDVNETELITAKSDYAEINHLICSLNDLARRFKDRHLEIHEYENCLSMSLKGGKSGIWNWNVKNDRVFFDDNYYLMAGYEPGDFPSDYNEWKIRVHPDHIANAEYKVQRCLNGEIEEFDVEFKFRRKDGSWMWILGIGRISESDQEGAIRFSGIHVDITERKQAEQEAKHLRNYLSNILNSMPSVLIGIDTEGIVTQWNRHAELITGFKVEEAMGSLLVGVYPQLSSEMYLIQKAIRTHQVQQKKHQPRIHNGNQVYEDITIYPVISTKVDGVVIRVDDVTELVRYEEMIVQSEKMLSVGGLAAGMAHEINNPLAGMVQNAFLIKSRLMDIQKPANVRAADEVGISLGKLREFMESRNIPRMINNIDEAGKRMSEIINNMLSFSRKTDLSAECYHPGQLMDQILEIAATDYDLKRTYDFKTITIKKEYQENLSKIACEGPKIQQVLLNILRNGAQAMIDGDGAEARQPTFVLRVYEDKTAGMMKIEIQDNGPGMDEATRKRVFEPFFTTKSSGEGTGLGLSVSYFIITENHGGLIDVESAPGKGSNFIIGLPLPH